MQEYGKLFARVYNERWAFFSNAIAPKIEQLVDARAKMTGLPNSLCDVCCGTGQFSNYFLKKSYKVHGIDLSPHMIEYAIANNRAYVDSGNASFVVADAASFELPEAVSYATCLFDAMNHLPNADAISSCVKRVFGYLKDGGLFIFDINTRTSLQRWTGISVQEDDELFMLNRGIYDLSMDRAYTQMTGFIREEDGKYTRFNEVAYNIALEVDEVLKIIKQAGFGSVYCADMDDLTAPAPSTESIPRVFFICQKA